MNKQEKPDDRLFEREPGRYQLYPWMYDIFLDPCNEGDLDWYRDRCLDFGGPVLELGCGSGRITIPLAEAGFEVHGMDRSIQMLERALAYAREQNVRERVHLIQDQMESFFLDETFPTALIPCNTIAHLTERDRQIQCFKQVRKHLTETGTLLLDIQQLEREAFQNGYLEVPWTDFITDPVGDLDVRRKYRAWIDNTRNCVDYEFVFEEKPAGGEEGSRNTRKAYHRLSMVTPTELGDRLREAGFSVENVYGDHSDTSYTGEDSWCCIVAHRMPLDSNE